MTTELSSNTFFSLLNKQKKKGNDHCRKVKRKLTLSRSSNDSLVWVLTLDSNFRTYCKSSLTYTECLNFQRKMYSNFPSFRTLWQKSIIRPKTPLRFFIIFGKKLLWKPTEKHFIGWLTYFLQIRVSWILQISKNLLFGQKLDF